MWSSSIVVSEDHNLSINVTEWSRRGFPCVLLHGFAEAGCVWSHLATRLLPQLRVLAIDLRGHGGSGWDPQARYETETFALDLGRVVAALRLERTVLIGHSLGADIAIRYTAAHPGQVAALVIIDFGPELTKAGVDEVMRAFADTPRTFASTDDYAQWLIERRPFADQKMLKQFARCSLRQSSGGNWELKADPALGAGSLLSRFEANGARYCDPAMWRELERIKCPTLIVRGVASGVLPYDVPGRMVDRLHAAGRLASIAAAGHSVMLDNPGELSTNVTGFLTAIPQLGRAAQAAGRSPPHR
jgi:pimeloyl-ACP methyl ester carboxylesterase